MSKHHVLLAATALAFAAGTAPAAADEPVADLQAAAQLHVRAVVDTKAAARIADESAARAKRLVVRGAERLEQAATIVTKADAQARHDAGVAVEAVVAARAELSQDAARQARVLAKLVKDAEGGLRRSAVTALAHVGDVQAHVAAEATAGCHGDAPKPDGEATAEAGKQVVEATGRVRVALETAGSKVLRDLAAELGRVRTELERGLATVTVASPQGSGTASVTVAVQAHVRARSGR